MSIPALQGPEDSQILYKQIRCGGTLCGRLCEHCAMFSFCGVTLYEGFVQTLHKQIRCGGTLYDRLCASSTAAEVLCASLVRIVLRWICVLHQVQ